jgi:aminoglycoside/choline kinase family phosphotransferase
METADITGKLQQLHRNLSGRDADQISELPGSGSYRRYFRLSSDNASVIGAFNADIKENRAFLTYARHFRKAGFPVPEILSSDAEMQVYLQQDLGDISLFDVYMEEKQHSPFSEKSMTLTKKVLDWLPRFQAGALDGFDFSIAYPRAAFDRQSILWDLSYFKYYFLKLARIPFDEQELENDFNTLTDFLLEADSQYFLYRDFQSRNIMILNDEPWFIDFQGGRRGALQYDPASLLFDAKADIPRPDRESLIQYYIGALGKELPMDEAKFRRHYHGYVLVRMLQAMGAFGFRGFYEKKLHFLDSIPFAVRNLDHLLDNLEIPVKLPSLLGVLRDMVNSEHLQSISSRKHTLSININSFSFRRGVPDDESGNGGGFVFDCRALPNPGRFEEYKDLSGNDLPVRMFLDEQDEVQAFIHRAMDMVRPSIENYRSRSFSNLMISFGCTGGRHRSVYCAEELASIIRKQSGVEVLVRHQGLENIMKP